jgi:hypothetical protein
MEMMPSAGLVAALTVAMLVCVAVIAFILFGRRRD